jgi:fumarylpyruvate hydrolase
MGPDGIFGYAVGVDLTRRDLQAAAKAKGQPWDAAKGFDHSAPISAIRKLATLGDAAISLSVNGEVRQKAQVGDMIWSVPEIVEEAGKLWDLQAGDLIFTGTPEGVAAVSKGDLVEGSVEGVGSLSFEIV